MINYIARLIMGWQKGAHYVSYTQKMNLLLGILYQDICQNKAIAKAMPKKLSSL